MRIYRASSLGSCELSLIAEQLGYKAIAPSEGTERLFREGDLHETDVVASLTADGAVITRQQDEVELFEEGRHPISWAVQGHLDGVIEQDYRFPRVLEIKSMGKEPFRQFKTTGWITPGLIQKYKWQLSVYMHATGLEALLVAKCRDNGELLKMPVEMPFYSLDDITQRVEYLESYVARGELPDTCPRDFFCNHRYLCPSVGEESQAPGDDELNPQELQAVSEYHRLGREIKALEDLRVDYRPAVEALAGRTASGYRITQSEQQIKERLVPASTRTMLRVTKLEDDSASPT